LLVYAGFAATLLYFGENFTGSGPAAVHWQLHTVQLDSFKLAAASDSQSKS
jgi:hypothetical protein